MRVEVDYLQVKTLLLMCQMPGSDLQFNAYLRVAGYSDYFNDLGPELQEEIIRRTEHTES